MMKIVHFRARAIDHSVLFIDAPIRTLDMDIIKELERHHPYPTLTDVCVVLICL